MTDEKVKPVDNLRPVPVLVAEDEPVTAAVLEAMLETLGYEPVVKPNGEAAWETYKELNPRIILTDWQMPGMTGIELCRNIRKAEQTEYTYIIVLTAAFKGKQYYKQAMDAGADDFLHKPCDRDELEARLRVAQRIIDFHFQVRELRQLIPICSYCKSVRNDQNYWQQIESYLHSQTRSQLTHGICPECVAKYFGKPK